MEFDPNGKSAKESGSKLDAGKAPVVRGLLATFPRACKAVALLTASGAEKYTWGGWQDVPDGIGRYADATGRHITDQVIEGEYVKDMPTVLHDTAVAWNALAKLELVLKEKENEESFSVPEEQPVPPTGGDMAGSSKLLRGGTQFPAGFPATGAGATSSITGGSGEFRSTNSSQTHLELADVMKQWQQRQDLEEALREEEAGWQQNPGYMPVDPTTAVQVVYRDGKTDNRYRAGDHDWTDCDDFNDIVKYRVATYE